METSASPQNLKAFVIGPIGDRDAESGSVARITYEQGLEALEHIIVPACEALDVDAFRADQISRSGEIPEQVFRHLRDAHIVIADLTDANPNVMYELGLRHTTGKLTFQIGERDRLPFDISTIRTIMFKRSEIGFIEAKRRLLRTIAEGLERGGDPVTSTRIWFESSSTIFAEDPTPDSSVEIDDGPGFLELLADTETGISGITQAFTTGASILEEIAKIMDDGGQRINDLPITGNYSAMKLATANRIAASLEDPALRLNIVAQDYARHFNSVSPGIIYMLRRLAESPEDLQESGDFPSMIEGLISAASIQRNSSNEFIRSIKKSGDATRSMRKISVSLSKSTESIRDTSGRIASWQEFVDAIPKIAHISQ